MLCPSVESGCVQAPGRGLRWRPIARPRCGSTGSRTSGPSWDRGGLMALLIGAFFGFFDQITKFPLVWRIVTIVGGVIVIIWAVLGGMRLAGLLWARWRKPGEAQRPNQAQVPPGGQVGFYGGGMYNEYTGNLGQVGTGRAPRPTKPRPPSTPQQLAHLADQIDDLIPKMNAYLVSETSDDSGTWHASQALTPQEQVAYKQEENQRRRDWQAGYLNLHVQVVALYEDAAERGFADNFMEARLPHPFVGPAPYREFSARLASIAHRIREDIATPDGGEG